jgi:putative ABC transport system permease protein
MNYLLLRFVENNNYFGNMNFYLAAIMLGLGFVALGFGIFISMRIFNIPDITTDGSYTLGGVVSAIILVKYNSVPVAITASIVAGILSGSITGFIHTKLKVNALLAGILVMTALYSVNLSLMGRSNIPLINIPVIYDWLSFIGDTVARQLSILMLITFCLILFLSSLLRTDFGIAMRATGNSEVMVSAMGIDTSKMKIIGLAISNGLMALSGSLITQYQGFADINMGIGIIILGLGSVMIGETLMSLLKIQSISGRLFGVIIGTIFFRLILAFVLSLGIDPNLLKLITALIVLIVVCLPNLRKVSN